jgi:hypothetical protein
VWGRARSETGRAVTVLFAHSVLLLCFISQMVTALATIVTPATPPVRALTPTAMACRTRVTCATAPLTAPR